MKYIRFFALCTAMIALCSVSASATERLVTIGTAGTSGVYYPAGGAICRLLQRTAKEHAIRCTVEATGGSVYNLNAIRSGELDFGIAQSDWVYHAAKGSDVFQDKGPSDKIRAVFALHSEPFTLVARDQAGIRKFADLKGKRVNVGNEGSGIRATMENLMHSYGWEDDVVRLASDLRASDQGQALCDKRVDAVVYTTGHPSAMVQQVAGLCPVKLLNVEGPEVERLIKENPFYTHALIPGGMYANNPSDVRTFGVKAILVTSQDTSEEAVYQIVKSVFDNLDDFKTLHPVFSGLEVNRMVKEGLILPLHPGAERYYREKGWL
jgi:TRAP transporter TAXI family solute receptor